jgi:hypothetical protein
MTKNNVFAVFMNSVGKKDMCKGKLKGERYVSLNVTIKKVNKKITPDEK